jgi:hypothetical protein
VGLPGWCVFGVAHLLYPVSEFEEWICPFGMTYGFTSQSSQAAYPHCSGAHYGFNAMKNAACNRLCHPRRFGLGELGGVHEIIQVIHRHLF